MPAIGLELFVQGQEPCSESSRFARGHLLGRILGLVESSGEVTRQVAHQFSLVGSGIEGEDSAQAQIDIGRDELEGQSSLLAAVHGVGKGIDEFSRPSLRGSVALG